MATATAAHVREYRSPLADGEKRLLVWIAGRLPAWVTSDHLTLLGITSMLGVGAAFWLSRWYPLALVFVVVALALNWFGDSLDGTVARVRNRLRPRYGYYVDHVVDITGTLFLFGGLALSGHMTPIIALGLLVAYMMVSAEVYLATHAHGVFRMSFLGFGPTELRIVLGIGALYLLKTPHTNLFGLGTYLLFDVGGLVAIAGLALAFVVSTVRTTRALYLAETVTR
jgi:archaetidylinositol phosphate synthase